MGTVSSSEETLDWVLGKNGMEGGLKGTETEDMQLILPGTALIPMLDMHGGVADDAVYSVTTAFTATEVHWMSACTPHE